MRPRPASFHLNPINLNIIVSPTKIQKAPNSATKIVKDIVQSQTAIAIKMIAVNTSPAAVSAVIYS